MKVKVENEPGLIRDTVTGAILNSDQNALKAYKEKKRKQIAMEEDINSLKNDIVDIKSMIKELIRRQ